VINIKPWLGRGEESCADIYGWTLTACRPRDQLHIISSVAWFAAELCGVTRCNFRREQWLLEFVPSLAGREVRAPLSHVTTYPTLFQFCYITKFSWLSKTSNCEQWSVCCCKRIAANEWGRGKVREEASEVLVPNGLSGQVHVAWSGTSFLTKSPYKTTANAPKTTVNLPFDCLR